MRVLLLDNIDSFTWNIFHYLEALGASVQVVTNQTVSEEDIHRSDAVVLSPGPGLPQEAGKLMWVIEQSLELGKPVLGVCLGMQALAEHFGGKLFNQAEVKHGVSEEISVQPSSVLFRGLPEKIKAGLYHSWAVVSDSVSPAFNCTAYSEHGVLMAMEKPEEKLFAVQFHPESILSEYGKEIFANFLNTIGKNIQRPDSVLPKPVR